MKIAFLVEFPTQFEVPFYQYVDNWIKEQRAKDFVSAQSDKEFDFHVIYNNTDQQDYHDFELGKKVGWGFNLYEGYTHFIADRNDIINSVNEIITRENYDFIILNGYKNSYKGLAELCKSKNIPIALRIDSVLYNLSPIKKFLKRIYLPFAYRKFDHFFAVGSETKHFLNWLGMNNQKISYFSYSIDEVWFSGKANDVEKVDALKKQFGIANQKVLISVAKFVPRESPWDILKAFEALNDTNLVLVLVGDGEDRKPLEAKANTMPHLKIIFTGYVPYQELGYYYGIADVFIHAAKNEPWGVSVHEALASGCTVITSDKVGSSKDLIIEGHNGFTYPFGDVEQLAQVIEVSLKFDGREKIITNKTVLDKWGYQIMWQNIKEFKKNKKMNVQYGCGKCAPLSWINFDISPTLRLEKLPIFGALFIRKDWGAYPKNVKVGDIVKGLPSIHKGTVQNIYCSHVLEHLCFKDMQKALVNTYKMLKPGGVFRMVVPDMELIVQEYIEDKANCKRDACHHLIKKTLMGVEKNPVSFIEKVTSKLGNSKHFWNYDYDSLAYELEKVGFTKIRRASFSDALDEAFKGVEDNGRWVFSLGIEAIK
jgi:hypothetical protein